MTPGQKAFIDAHLDIFANCQECTARVARFARNAFLPNDPSELKLARTPTHVTCVLGLDERDREQITRKGREGVWEGLCSCRRRWRYSQDNYHSHTGKLKVGLCPEPVAATPQAGSPSADSPVLGQSAAKPAPAPGPQSISASAVERGPAPPTAKLRKRAGTRLPFVDDKAGGGPYFATMYRHDDPIRQTLSHRKGSFILLLKPKKSAHKHPEPLARPELQNLRARCFDEAHVVRNRPALLEVHTEYFDESVLEDLCCLDVSVLASSCGCLYRRRGPAAYDTETPGGFSRAMPDVPGMRRGVDPETLRGQIAEEFPGIVGAPARPTKESGVLEGRSTDVLAQRGLGRHRVVLAVEWSTTNYVPEHCPNGRVHAPMMQRRGVRDWIRHSESTTGFITAKNEPMLIAMRAAPTLLDAELCCLSVRILVPTTGTSLHRFAPGKVRWETR